MAPLFLPVPLRSGFTPSSEPLKAPCAWRLYSHVNQDSLTLFLGQLLQGVLATLLGGVQFQ